MQSHDVQIDRYQSVFREEVLSRLNRIDPHKSEDWYSLALGWAIAKGIPPEIAHEFSKQVRYYTDIEY